MSNYGNPPTDPYGQPPAGQDPYGQPPQGSYGQDPYAQQNPYGAQPPAAYSGVPQGVTFAHWGKRVGGALIDGLVSLVGMVPAAIGLVMFVASVETTTDPVTGAVTSESTGGTGAAVALIVIGALLTFAIAIWNVIFKQGTTGYTIGKGIMGIKLVKAETGLPIGVGMALVRYIVTQLISGITCGIGGLLDVLWPLWDDKKQTLHDKVVGTYVIDLPKH